MEPPGKRVRPSSLQDEHQQIDQNRKASPSSKGKLKLVSGNFELKDLKEQKTLTKGFFRQEVVELAKNLLGKVIVRKTQEGFIRAVIVQTEAYKAPLDKACHAYNNKKTERTKYFWLDGGHLYIYTIYMPTNICLNVVAGLEGQPQAVLIRAVQPVEGIDIIQMKKKLKSKKIEDLTNGPGKVGMSLQIDKDAHNGINLMEGDIKVVDYGISGFEVEASKRINIDYAQQWIDKPWRFYIKANTFVSKPPAPKK